MRSEAWSAIADGSTVGIAVAAAIFAYYQVVEARRTRERMAQPNVVVFIDHNPNGWQHTDLVIKNFGQTTAYRIHITSPPFPVVPYVKASDGIEINTLQMPSHIGVLAPGQEWRTVIDSAVDRKALGEELSDNDIVGDVSFTDTMVPDFRRRTCRKPKKPYRNPVWLDPKLFKNMLRVPPGDPTKQISDKIGEVADALNTGNEPDKGLWVYTVPGDEESLRRTRRARARVQHDQRELKAAKEFLTEIEQHTQAPVDDTPEEPQD
ncbi:MAG TPA: hypothetical protein VJU54_03235 [Nitrospiraceae bacterium]|nr:hypothetical protein [Nitrospiraceae bacterium]